MRYLFKILNNSTLNNTSPICFNGFLRNICFKSFYSSADKLLFTPGPLSTSPTVKEAMLSDLGSRENEFVSVVKNIRTSLLEIGNVSNKNYESIILQGSGTFSVEAVISSVPKGSKLLVIVNGAYGERILKMTEIYGISTVTLGYCEDEIPNADDVRKILKDEEDITHVVTVHSETTSGVINPIHEIGKVIMETPQKSSNKKRTYIVDAMSSFGAYEIDITGSGIDFIISSSNKCIQGVPGFAFILAEKNALEKTESRTLSLDLLSQVKGLNSNGQFRFTPPTHTLLAFNQALKEFKTETLQGRINRYRENKKILVDGMSKLGFKEYVDREYQGHIITSFCYPERNFNFQKFYQKLYDKNFVIYPGKVSNADCFRIGSIGHLFKEDFKNLLSAIGQIKQEMKF